MWICVESKEASTAAQWRNDLQQIVDGEDSLKDVLCVADPGGPGIETLNLCAVVVHQDFMHTTAEERSTSCLSIKTHLTSHGQWIIMVVNKTIQRRIARPHRWKELKKRIGFGKRIDTLPIRPRPVVEKALLTSPRRGSLSPFKISQSPKPVAHFQPWEGGGGSSLRPLRPKNSSNPVNFGYWPSSWKGIFFSGFGTNLFEFELWVKVLENAPYCFLAEKLRDVVSPERGLWHSPYHTHSHTILCSKHTCNNDKHTINLASQARE